MRRDRVIKLLTSSLMIMALVLTGLFGSAPRKAEAAISANRIAAIKLSATSTYLHLGNSTSSTYDFNISNKVTGSAYYWYVKEDKGNPSSVTINKSNGVVTAKEIGTAYIRCRITLPDGQIIRPEAKVTVINNITQVAISNLPENMSITAGDTYDFNRTVISTEGGSEAKTNGITRWEVFTDNTAGVTSVDNSGVVKPTKAGEFAIRAVAFESTAKYNLWLSNKVQYAGYVTAASDWTNIIVNEPKGDLEAADFGVMDFSGVKGYNIGFNLIDAKASDVNKIEIVLKNNNEILGLVVSDKIMEQYPEAVTLSAPIDVFGGFDYAADQSWTYSGWKGSVSSIPTEAVVTVTFKNGVVKTVNNTNLSGDLTIFTKGNAKAADFGVMNFSDIMGYNVGFDLIDTKASDIKSVVVKVSNEQGVLATAIAKDLLTLYPDATSLSVPMDVFGEFDYSEDKSWEYSGWKGQVSDIPTSAEIVLIYKNGVIKKILNTNLTGDTSIFTKGDAEATDFGVMNFSGVFGYSVGFNLIDAKTSEVEKVEIKLSNENGVLATATSNELLTQYPEAVSLSAPFDTVNEFDYTVDKSWNYSGWNGKAFDLPTEAEITVTFKNGVVKTVKNTGLTGDTSIFTKGNAEAADFGVMNFSDIIGYNIGFNLLEAKASDVKSIEISLLNGEIVLATAVTNELLTQYPDAVTLSAPFDVLGSFDYTADKSWTYSGWNGVDTDIPTQAKITVTFKNDIVKTVTNSNLTGDTTIFHKNVETPIIGVLAYNVSVNLVDSKASEVESIVVTLEGASGELATLTSNEILAQNPEAVKLNAPFYVNGGFDYVADKNWTYSGWKGNVNDIPTKAIITVTFKNGIISTTK